MINLIFIYFFWKVFENFQCLAQSKCSINMNLTRIMCMCCICDLCISAFHLGLKGGCSVHCLGETSIWLPACLQSRQVGHLEIRSLQPLILDRVKVLCIPFEQSQWHCYSQDCILTYSSPCNRLPWIAGLCLYLTILTRYPGMSTPFPMITGYSGLVVEIWHNYITTWKTNAKPQRASSMRSVAIGKWKPNVGYRYHIQSAKAESRLIYRFGILYHDRCNFKGRAQIGRAWVVVVEKA